MQKLVHNGLLSVSDTGRVYKVMKDGRLKELAQHGISRGRRYLCVRPSINGKQVTFYVHRLVAEAFCIIPKIYRKSITSMEIHAITTLRIWSGVPQATISVMRTIQG